MKPFDLDAAVDGEKVLLRNGTCVTIVAYNPNTSEDCRVVGLDEEWTKK